MKNGMYLHRAVKFQPEGVTGNLPCDFEWAVPSMIQLCQWSLSLPILTVEPHKIPHLLVRSRETMGVHSFLVAELDAMHFCLQVVMNFGKYFRHRTRLLIFWLVG